MQRARVRWLVSAAVFTVLLWHVGGSVPRAAAGAAAAPAFDVDPYWPKPLPNNWVVGNVVGVAVDAKDNVYLLHREKSQAGGDKTPPVLKFNRAGNLVGSWGGRATIPEWGTQEHSIHVDYKGNVWVSFSGGLPFAPPMADPDGSILKEWQHLEWFGNAHVLKLSPEGKVLLEIGKFGKTGGSGSKEYLGGPTGVFVDQATDEVYIADGYINHRVIVFDANTGAYKRMWGAYGKPPTDAPQARFDRSQPPPQQFNTPHCAVVSKDGLVYVCDRGNQRIQVFKRDGTFVKESFINGTLPDGRTGGTPWEIAFSLDAQQKQIFLVDGGNHVLHTLDRDSLAVVSTVGHRGRWAGEFESPHDIAIDSKGNLFIGETLDGRRLQKFVPKGTLKKSN